MVQSQVYKRRFLVKDASLAENVRQYTLSTTPSTASRYM